VEAARHGRPAPAAVDGRADQYALGLVLYQLLGGPMPADARAAARLPRHNPDVSTGLADILRRCLIRDPAARYPTAAALADDLRRYLTDRPLRGVPNRSLAERWRKWRRRRPYALPAAAVLLAVLAVTAAAADLAWQRYAAPRRALADGQALLDRGECDRAAEVLAHAREQAAALPFTAGLRAALDDQLTRAHESQATRRRATAVRELHELVERIRFAAAADPVPVEQARALEGPCRALWAARDRLLVDPAGAADEGLRADLLDLAVIAAGLRVQLTPPGEAAAARRAALDALDEAEELLGLSPALALERARHARALGRPASDDLPRPPRTAWEHIALGRALDHAGRPDRAADEFSRAADLAPGNFWAHFHLGRCALRLNRPAEAVTAFTAAIALQPHPAGYYNRALARKAAGDATRAAADFARAADLDPARAVPIR
jgi:tetratricopeptide (TPR) repeat protein